MTADPFLVVFCPRCDARHHVSGVEAADYDAERKRIGDGFLDMGCPACAPEAWGREVHPDPVPPMRIAPRRLGRGLNLGATALLMLAAVAGAATKE